LFSKNPIKINVINGDPTANKYLRGNSPSSYRTVLILGYFPLIAKVQTFSERH
jgi:hypothetical protein